MTYISDRLYMSGVSEELSSVETAKLYSEAATHFAKFQKNLVVWKLPFHILDNSPYHPFQKNLVVWKRIIHSIIPVSLGEGFRRT